MKFSEAALRLIMLHKLLGGKEPTSVELGDPQNHIYSGQQKPSHAANTLSQQESETLTRCWGNFANISRTSVFGIILEVSYIWGGAIWAPYKQQLKYLS